MAFDRSLRSLLGGVLCLAAVLAACSSPQSPTARTVIQGPTTPPTPEPDVGFPIAPVRFADVPGWGASDLKPAHSAFMETCASLRRRSPAAHFALKASYGGLVQDWLPACDRMEAAIGDSEAIRTAIEESFVAYMVDPEGPESKLTGYFEPELEVRRYPEPGFTKAVPGIPFDLVRADPSDFDQKYPKGKIWGRVSDGVLEYYPPRAEIIDDPATALAYADPGEVFYLQIQGSGRLKFPDGRVMRAAFAAHNHRPFVSIARHLIDTGEIEIHQAGMGSILNWMRQVGSERAQAAMNVNPRYVWFTPQEITDPNKGPNGAAGVPLMPMGSMAVDPKYHPYGALMFIDTKVPAHPGDWQGTTYQSLVVAQDTGGAIKGLKRGDLFFGWGKEAGGRAASMNHPVDMWILLPKALSNRMVVEQTRASKTHDG